MRYKMFSSFVIIEGLKIYQFVDYNFQHFRNFIFDLITLELNNRKIA